jgi:hypothetical protein
VLCCGGTAGMLLCCAVFEARLQLPAFFCHHTWSSFEYCNKCQHTMLAELAGKSVQMHDDQLEGQCVLVTCFG